jgi:elongation factor P hydroxylase
VAALTTFAACRTPPAVPLLPSKGGPTWVEVSTAHFTLWTDSPERAHDLVQTMERLREVVFGTALFSGRDEGYRTFVIALANKQEVGEYLPHEFDAYASSAGALFQPVIVVSADSLDDKNHRRILTHELTHVISYGPLPTQPHWFSEALATFYETAELDGNRVDLGIPTDGRVDELRSEHTLPLAQLFACKQHGCMDTRFYANAWALFTFLATEHGTELLAYMNMLAVTPEAEQDALWARAFPSLASLDDADHAFHAWIAHGNVLVRQYTVKHGTWDVRDRPLTDADALAARGTARFIIDHDKLPVEITDAVAIDPNEVVARMIQSRSAGSIPVEAARAVTAAHPADWRAWFLLGRALHEGQEAHDAHAKACELIAKNAVSVPAKFCP